jgi:SAM-dependent methyltransferase
LAHTSNGITTSDALASPIPTGDGSASPWPISDRITVASLDVIKPAEPEMPSPLSQLLSIPGRRLLDRLARDDVTPDQSLRLGAELRKDYPGDLVAAAMGQHELRLLARQKFARAMQMHFTRSGLEQASSESTARWRARRWSSATRVADLCCGIGGDLIGLAAGRQVVAVDLDPVHLHMARLNARVYQVGGAVTIQLADAREVDLAGFDGAFIDPARRSARGRKPAGRSEPPLDWCIALADRLAAVGIKAAPGLPRSFVPQGWEVEFIADGRDLKEAALWSPALASAGRRATILPAGHTLTDQPGPAVSCQPPGAYLLDPNPAVTRAGLVEELARELGAWKIDEQIAFLSTDNDVRSPFARTLRIIESAPWNEKQFATLLRSLDIGAVDIRRRGLAGAVDQIHRRLRLHGSRRATVVITRVADRPWGLICTDPDDAPPPQKA